MVIFPQSQLLYCACSPYSQFTYLSKTYLPHFKYVSIEPPQPSEIECTTLSTENAHRDYSLFKQHKKLACMFKPVFPGKLITACPTLINSPTPITVLEPVMCIPRKIHPSQFQNIQLVSGVVGRKCGG